MNALGDTKHYANVKVPVIISPDGEVFVCTDEMVLTLTEYKEPDTKLDKLYEPKPVSEPKHGKPKMNVTTLRTRLNQQIIQSITRKVAM
jgi:hypothetical protein